MRSDNDLFKKMAGLYIFQCINNKRKMVISCKNPILGNTKMQIFTEIRNSFLTLSIPEKIVTTIFPLGLRIHLTVV